ncbi:transposase [Hymenobacter sp. BT594]|uniref:Transposase n=1 Tax=Hymenobacter guriensis TaxID=2793065 RepID=A0ABS0L0T8_9BACT|nr:transposase [Hymenobacter guriensis]
MLHGIARTTEAVGAAIQRSQESLQTLAKSHGIEAERFFGRLKEARGFATRYDKSALSFLATAHLLAALDWIR